MGGHYAARPATATAWVPGHWEQSAAGYTWVQGHWE
ncbi:MAG: YXWGXW repeat-containing protein [Alphaproteobacteria bacterium]|nr:YXWGXW repeat-containing protein [Alphaproteobacteria bacterium]